MADKKHKITIKTEYISEGRCWPVDIHFDVPYGTPQQVKVTMKDLTAWLTVAGFRPGMTTPIQPPIQNGSQQLNGSPMPQQQAMAPQMQGAAPICPIHQEPMKPSKVQKNPSQVAYYCSKQGPAGYCTHRGAVSVTGELSAWEVK